MRVSADYFDDDRRAAECWAGRSRRPRTAGRGAAGGRSSATACGGGGSRADPGGDRPRRRHRRRAVHRDRRRDAARLRRPGRGAGLRATPRCGSRSATTRRRASRAAPAGTWSSSAGCADGVTTGGGRGGADRNLPRMARGASARLHRVRGRACRRWPSCSSARCVRRCCCCAGGVALLLARGVRQRRQPAAAARQRTIGRGGGACRPGRDAGATGASAPHRGGAALGRGRAARPAAGVGGGAAGRRRTAARVAAPGRAVARRPRGGVAVLLAVASGIVFGLAPLRQLGRRDAADELRGAGRRTGGAGGVAGAGACSWPATSRWPRCCSPGRACWCAASRGCWPCSPGADGRGVLTMKLWAGGPRFRDGEPPQQIAHGGRVLRRRADAGASPAGRAGGARRRPCCR